MASRAAVVATNGRSQPCLHIWLELKLQQRSRFINFISSSEERAREQTNKQLPRHPKTPINRKSTGKNEGPDEPPYLKSLSKPEFSQPGTFKYSVPRKEQATFCGGEQGIEFGQLLLHLASIPSDVHSEDLWNHSQVASPVAKTLLPSPWIKAVTSPTRSPGP